MDRPPARGLATKGQTSCAGGVEQRDRSNKGTDLLSVDCRGSWKESLELVHLCRTMNGWWGWPFWGVFEQRDRPSGVLARGTDKWTDILRANKGTDLLAFWRGGPTNGQTSCARTKGQTFWRSGAGDRQMDRPLARGGAKPTKEQTYWTKTGKGRPRGQAFWREGIGSGAGWKTGIGLRVWVYGERDAGISGRSAGALRARAILFPGPRSFSGAGCFLLVPWGSFRGTNGYGDPAPGCCSYPAGWVVAGEGLGGSGRMRKKRRTTMRSRRERGRLR
jgi:hypothetical protein